MSDLGVGLLFVAVQTTLLISVAIPLALWLERRGPVAGVLVSALCLGLLLLLPIAALLPLPASWTAAPAPTAAAANLTDATSTDAEPTPASVISPPLTSTVQPPPGPSWAALRDLWQGLSRPPAPDADAARPVWLDLLALTLLAGCVLSLMRILLGLVAVSRLRRHGQPIRDSAACAVLRELCQHLGLGCAVDLRETGHLGTAATIGWRRPLILLPTDWRDWTTAEFRAVLAHELAHVRRGDFLLGLLARLSTALHWYHPLVHWLAGRLRLQQEMSADVLGATLAGGRDCYLVALTRQALRADNRPSGWLAQPFWPATGTVMRRIHMLQVKEWQPQRGLSRLYQGAAVLLLCAAAVAVSTLRHTAPLYADEPDDTGTLTIAAAVEPFDLSYLPNDGQGFVALRPSALFGRQDMKRITALANKYLPLGLAAIGVQGELGLAVEDIEQLLCRVDIQYNGNVKDGPKGSFSVIPHVLRVRHKFDWAEKIKTLAPKIVETAYHGRSYFTFPNSIPLGFIFGQYIYAADDRTLVLASEEHVRALIDGTVKPRQVPHWDAVKEADVALWFSLPRDVKDYMIKTRSDDSEMIKYTDATTFGCTCRTDLFWQAFVSCPDAKAAKKAAKAIRTFLDRLKGELSGGPETSKDELKPLSAKLVRMSGDFLRPDIRPAGATVHLTCRAECPLALYLEFMLRDIGVKLDE
jgi:beta-lactamase regulating signal transducer with metallopeptidase domain